MAGAPVRILLSTDRTKISADGEDVAVVTAQVVDSQGREAPLADNELAFKISGLDRLLGLGIGDPSSHELDTADSRRAFNGLCMALIQSAKTSDEIHVEASSPGLVSGTVTIQSVSVTPRPVVP